MKLEDQVTSLEHSKKLKELGVKQESLFYWIPNKNKKMVILPVVHDSLVMYENGYSAFTIAELGELLPDGLFTRKVGNKWYGCEYHEDLKIFSVFTKSDTEAGALARMLIYLIENKLISL